MKVEVLYFEGCPNHEPAVRLAREVVHELGLGAPVEEVEITSPEDAERLRFLGSPTILVDGVDVEPGARSRTDYGFSCRTYGGTGVPRRELVADAMRGNTETGEPHGGPPSSPSSAGTSAPKGQGTLLAVIGSVVSAVVASACCWLPLLLLGFGASAAGVSTMFERARPVFLVSAFGLLGLGFFFAYGRKEACAPGEACAVPNPRLKRLNRVMLWGSAVVVAAFAFFPSYAGLLLAETTKAVPAQGSAPSPTVTLGIEGMSCEACAVHIVKGLEKVPGVRSATVSYDDKTASVSVDPVSPPSRDALAKAVKGAGYEVTSVTGAR